MKLGEVLVLHAPELRPDVDATAFEAHIRNDVVLVRKDRGPHPGRYLLAAAFEKSLRALVVDFSAASGTFVSGRGQSVEYHLVGPETLGALPDADVLGIHYHSVRPDRRDAFDRFVADAIHPAVGNLRPDLRLLYYKAVSGPDGSDG